MMADREMVDEAIKKSEKESHDARVEAKEAEEAAERALIIGIPFLKKNFLSRCLFIASKIHHYAFYYSQPFATTEAIQS
jgi:hypothetical protein